MCVFVSAGFVETVYSMTSIPDCTSRSSSLAIHGKSLAHDLIVSDVGIERMYGREALIVCGRTGAQNTPKGDCTSTFI